MSRRTFIDSRRRRPRSGRAGDAKNRCVGPPGPQGLLSKRPVNAAWSYLAARFSLMPRMVETRHRGQHIGSVCSIAVLRTNCVVAFASYILDRPSQGYIKGPTRSAWYTPRHQGRCVKRVTRAALADLHQLHRAVPFARDHAINPLSNGRVKFASTFFEALVVQDFYFAAHVPDQPGLLQSIF